MNHPGKPHEQRRINTQNCNKNFTTQSQHTKESWRKNIYCSRILSNRKINLLSSFQRFVQVVYFCLHMPVRNNYISYINYAIERATINSIWGWMLTAIGRLQLKTGPQKWVVLGPIGLFQKFLRISIYKLYWILYNC